MHEDNQAPSHNARLALDDIRTAVKRIGTPGGNLKGRITANLNCIEQVLTQLDSAESILRTQNTTSQLLVKTFNDIRRIAAPTSEHHENGDPSETKGA